MMSRFQLSKQLNRKYDNIDGAVFRYYLKYETLQYLYAPFCKIDQKPKSGYVLAGAGFGLDFVKMAGFWPEPKSGTAPVYMNSAFSSLIVHHTFSCQKLLGKRFGGSTMTVSAAVVVII